jgi:imidazolonepropionase-like amidohydrolase
MRIFVLLLTLIATASAAQDPLLLYNGNLVNVLDGRVTSESILIRGNSIEKTGSYDQLKRGVPAKNQVDCKGKYIIPGLWDMHIHLEGADLVEDNRALIPVFLAYGITSVRDCASDLGEQVLAWRNEIASGKMAGPTIYTAGLKLEGKNSIWKGDLEIENEAELNLMLDKLDGFKVDFVKITDNALSGDLFLKSVKAAHARGYRVSGHVPIEVPVGELVNAGFTSIEHAGYLMRLGGDEDMITSDLKTGKITKAEAGAFYASTFDQSRAIRNYASLAKTGVYVCPTYIGGRQLAYLHEVDHSKDEPLSFLTEKFVSNYQWRIQRMGSETPEQRQQRKDNYQQQLKQLPLLQKAGLKIIAGSDAAALNTMVYPAASLIEELEIFEEAGLTPLQILQAATVNPASYFGLESKTARIAEGRVADLAILNENPLTSTKALRRVDAVVSRGTYFDRTALDGILAQARREKERLDKDRSK